MAVMPLSSAVEIAASPYFKSTYNTPPRVLWAIQCNGSQAPFVASDQPMNNISTTRVHFISSRYIVLKPRCFVSEQCSK
jgi:hypothetical protein